MNHESQYWKNRIAEALETQCEQNDIDFKEDLSENNTRLKEHINAMAHCAGGGALVFGVNARFQKSDRILNLEDVIARISNLAHDTQEPPIGIEVHHISTNLGKLLCLHILPPKTTPDLSKTKVPSADRHVSSALEVRL